MQDGRSKRSQKSTALGIASGSTGGAATAHGINYQYKFAIYQALKAVNKTLAAPHRKLHLKLEPRTVTASGLARWDFAVLGTGEVVELKLNPTRKDVLEWIDRVREGNSESITEMRLVRNAGLGALIALLRRLIQIAKEADKPSDFDDLVAKEGLLVDSEDIRRRLGVDAHNILKKLRIDFLPESILEEQIDFLATGLSGENGGIELREMLFNRVATAAESRETIDVTDLIEQIRGRKIVLHPPQEVDPADLSNVQKLTLLILQECRAPLPQEVLAAVLRPALPLNTELATLIDEKIVDFNDSTINLTRVLPATLTDSNSANILAETLTALLGFIQAAPSDPLSMRQVRNAMRLASKSIARYPHAVIPLFQVLHKLLKRLGNKHLVFEAAELTLDATRRATPRTHDVVEREVQALICGRSWVYQRIGRIQEARAAGEKSLNEGRAIGSDRNTAYCLKCLGRMWRVEAEQEKDDSIRIESLGKSKVLLTDAIQQFSESPAFGPNDPEVGDCYSLLARTHLVAREFPAAGKAIQTAARLISDVNSKDYIDLVILQGDLAADLGDNDGAEGYYNEAIRISIGEDNERTEMRARALLQRGKVLQRLNRANEARLSYSEAAEIWNSLEEPKAAAVAELEARLLNVKLLPEEIRMLRAESPAVSNTALRFHEEKLNRIPVGSRRGLSVGVEYWSQLFKTAKEDVVIHHPDW